MLFDDGRSEKREALLLIESLGDLSIEGEARPCGTIDDLKVPPRVGNTSRFFKLPDGRGFETRDNENLDLALSQHSDSPSLLPFRIENNLKAIATAVALMIAIVYVGVTRGIPFAGDWAAAQIPNEVRLQLGAEALNQLDTRWLSESTLSIERQAELQELLARLAEGTEANIRFEARGGAKVGPNALALPDGTIVITDELVELAGNDDEIAAVLLHEIGHVELDHGTRSLVRQIGVSLIVVVLSGDIATASSLLIALPAIALTMRYSRGFESEADDYALQRMLSLGIDPRAFAEMMRALESYAEESGADTQSDSESKSDAAKKAAEDLFAYFASHPASPERIAKFESAAANLKP